MYLIATIVLSCITIFFAYSVHKQKSKLKNNLYDICSSLDEKGTKYHLVIEWGHGKYIDTRKLSLIPVFTLLPGKKEELSKTFDDYESAHNALETFKQRINHLSTQKDRSKKRNTFAV